MNRSLVSYLRDQRNLRETFSGILFLFIVSLLPFHLNAKQDTARVFVRSPYDSLVRAANLKMAKYIDHDNSLVPYYSINSKGVTIYRDSTATIHLPEFFIAWDEVSIFQNMLKILPKDSVMNLVQQKGTKPFTAQQRSDYAFGKIPVKVRPNDAQLPLKGLKIAIDPGHTAGDTAGGRIEDKYVLFKAKRVPAGLDTNMYSVHQVGDSVEIHLVEGVLTWKVAEALAAQLRAQGANVLLTRSGPGMTAFGKTFEQWKIDDYKRTLDSLLKKDSTNKYLLKLKSGAKKDDRFIFHYVFRDVELKKRAEIINNFHPDLTIVIHFNVDEKNKDWLKTSDRNFCMAFVPGSIEKGEMDEPESRFDLLRLILTDDIQNSIAASAIATKQFNKVLNVPLAKTNDATYLQEHCMSTGQEGVFCRNLQLTRMIEGPMIYGETLYQDNYLECLKLSSYFSNQVEGVPEPIINYPRLDDVERAYYNAVMEWAKTQ